MKLLSLAPLAALPLLAMSSPWWENYDIKTSYRCRDKNLVIVERNDSQASLISGRYRTTLFRETSDQPGLRFTNETLRLILNGDELTLEQPSQRLQCQRTEQV